MKESYLQITTGGILGIQYGIMMRNKADITQRVRIFEVLKASKSQMVGKLPAEQSGILYSGF